MKNLLLFVLACLPVLIFAQDSVEELDTFCLISPLKELTIKDAKHLDAIYGNHDVYETNASEMMRLNITHPSTFCVQILSHDGSKLTICFHEEKLLSLSTSTFLSSDGKVKLVLSSDKITLTWPQMGLKLNSVGCNMYILTKE